MKTKLLSLKRPQQKYDNIINLTWHTYIIVCLLINYLPTQWTSWIYLQDGRVIREHQTVLIMTSLLRLSDHTSDQGRLYLRGRVLCSHVLGFGDYFTLFSPFDSKIGNVVRGQRRADSCWKIRSLINVKLCTDINASSELKQKKNRKMRLIELLFKF
jgi:hypothetical protein